MYVDNDIHLFYIGHDGHIHDLVQDATSQTWAGKHACPLSTHLRYHINLLRLTIVRCPDRTIEHTGYEDDPIRNFDVTIDAGTSALRFFLLVGDSLWLSNAQGKTLLGEVMGDGQVDLVDKKQNGWVWCSWCTPPQLYWGYQRVPIWGQCR